MPFGGLPTATRGPNETRRYAESASEPGAEIVARQVSPASSTLGGPGSIVVGSRRSSPSRDVILSSVFRSSSGSSTSPNADGGPSPRSNEIFVRFSIEISEDQPSSVSSNERTPK